MRGFTWLPDLNRNFLAIVKNVVLLRVIPSDRKVFFGMLLMQIYEHGGMGVGLRWKQ